LLGLTLENVGGGGVGEEGVTRGWVWGIVKLGDGETIQGGTVMFSGIEVLRKEAGMGGMN